MRPTRTTSRRSFLTAGAALALVGGSEAGAQNIRYSGVTDCDSGNGADRPGYGTGVRNQVTDNDTGPGSDTRCHGRGSNTGSTGTPYNPNAQPDTRCSDSDYGEYGDPAGHGRSCRGGYGGNLVRGQSARALPAPENLCPPRENNNRHLCALCRRAIWPDARAWRPLRKIQSRRPRGCGFRLWDSRAVC